MNNKTKFESIDNNIKGWIRFAAEQQRLAIMNMSNQETKCICTVESMENSYAVCECSNTRSVA